LPVGVKSELICSLSTEVVVVGPETMLPALGLPRNTVVVVVVVVTRKVSVNVPACVPVLPEFPTSHGRVVSVVTVSVVTTVSTHRCVNRPWSLVTSHCGWADAPAALKATNAAITAASVSSNPMRFFIGLFPFSCFPLLTPILAVGGSRYFAPFPLHTPKHKQERSCLFYEVASCMRKGGG
jgi:hypothetical protein